MVEFYTYVESVGGAHMRVIKSEILFFCGGSNGRGCDYLNRPAIIKYWGKYYCEDCAHRQDFLRQNLLNKPFLFE